MLYQPTFVICVPWRLVAGWLISGDVATMRMVVMVVVMIMEVVTNICEGVILPVTAVCKALVVRNPLQTFAKPDKFVQF